MGGIVFPVEALHDSGIKAVNSPIRQTLFTPSFVCSIGDESANLVQQKFEQDTKSRDSAVSFSNIMLHVEHSHAKAQPITSTSPEYVPSKKTSVPEPKRGTRFPPV